MIETSRYSECGHETPADGPAGLCPQCLLQVGLESHAPGDSLFEPIQSAPSASPSAFELPTTEQLAHRFPQLEILELIGRGGMGVVYKARQKDLDRFVAVKILPPGVNNDPAFAERFTHEAKALAKLNHPNIVTLYEFGQVDGLFFFLMEFVDGMNLRQLLNAGRMAPPEAVAIVPQICDALQYAHDAGIVHRDIKPENILLDRRGRVKVADFGLAKLAERPEPLAAGIVADSTKLTEAGKVVGTPQYMAPEQFDHPSEVDHRADIYSLGVVFYQMLTGELPKGDFAPPSAKGVVDVRLDEVVMRALEKQPKLRYQQVGDVKTVLETIVTTHAQGSADRPTAPATRWQTKRLFVALAAGSAVLGMLGYVALTHDWNSRDNRIEMPHAANVASASSPQTARIAKPVEAEADRVNVVRTKMLGFVITSKGYKAFDEVPGGGALLIGVQVGVGTFLGHPTIYSLKPIFQTLRGEVIGHQFGKFDKGQVVIKAKSGFAVGGLMVKEGLGIDGFSATFMRIKGSVLDPADSYTSDWIGDKAVGRETRLAGRGASVVGIFGRLNPQQTLGGLGLVLDANGPIEPWVYDKALWHADGDKLHRGIDDPDGTPMPQSMVHPGMFIGWLIDHDMITAKFLPQTAGFKRREITGAKVYEKWNSRLASDMLTNEGNQFARYYFYGQYAYDYTQLVKKDPHSGLHVADTWENYNAISKKIDERYAEWKRTLESKPVRQE